MQPANGRQRRLSALIVLVVYLVLFLALNALIGPFASILASLPGIIWAILLGKRAGFLVGVLLIIPNYLILARLHPERGTDLLPFLVGGHFLVGIVSYIVGDIYALRQSLAIELAERKISEARFRSLFDHTNDAIFILGMDMVIQDVNEQAALMLGYQVGELVGLNHRVLVPPTEQDDLHQKLAQLMAGETLPIYERSYIRKDRSIIRVEINAALVYDNEGHPHYIQSISRDITDRKMAEEKLYYQATHDALTGTYNRNMFFELVAQAIQRARRTHSLVAVLFLDLDGFKLANDTHGHAFGDLVLVEAAERIGAELRVSDAVARVGGDEFAALLEGLANRPQVEVMVSRLGASLSEPYEFGNLSAEISASIGGSLYPDDGADVDQLINIADQKMYAAKQALYASREGAR